MKQAQFKAYASTQPSWENETISEKTSCFNIRGAFTGLDYA